MYDKEFNEVISEQIKISQDLLLSKNSAYNPGTDKLHNFKVAANLQGISTKKALAGMMAKHTTSIYDLCSSDEETIDMDVWVEKITDHINYLLLLKAVLVDELSNLIERNEYTTLVEDRIVEGMNITKPPNVISEEEVEEAESYTAYVER